MKYEEAIQVLIKNAAKNVVGVGCGLRSEIKEKDIQEVRDAIIIVWNKTYKNEYWENILTNLGL